ncbi:MAG: type II toxin-antitoxin system death-on-curing family toxin [Clostridia bacterium]|nr:type II toxin-antitoxin system death-on-curing family toxin [Clostridia bacterium]
MIWLSKKQIISLHSQLINETGGSYGIRDEKLLESAIYSPFQTFESVNLFPSAVAKIARLSCGLTQNHPFIDGNKRIGAFTMLILLELNNISIDYSQEELVNLFLDLASNKISYEHLHDWIISHIV